MFTHTFQIHSAFGFAIYHKEIGTMYFNLQKKQGWRETGSTWWYWGRTQMP